MENKKVMELKEIAKEMGIKNISKMKKADLIFAIKSNETKTKTYNNELKDFRQAELEMRIDSINSNAVIPVKVKEILIETAKNTDLEIELESVFLTRKKQEISEKLKDDTEKGLELDMENLDRFFTICNFKINSSYGFINIQFSSKERYINVCNYINKHEKNQDHFYVSSCSSKGIGSGTYTNDIFNFVKIQGLSKYELEILSNLIAEFNY
ncbi:MAG: Rho termination factor N-terminal domain-containing protein [Cetobacterium sp.]